jgi:hypothetical protein
MLQKQGQINLGNQCFHVSHDIGLEIHFIRKFSVHPDGDLDNTPCQRRGGWGCRVSAWSATSEYGKGSTRVLR